MARSRFIPDNFTLAILLTVIVASVLPCSGNAASTFNAVTNGAICLLFFLHGAKLPRAAVIAGLSHWRLHLLVLIGTFVLFPVLGLLLRPVLAPLVTPDLYLGILFLCVLPSTVQSSIAFTAVARGNVPAAICSASASNLIGVFLTPILAGLLVAKEGNGHSSFDAVWHIGLQLLVPFIAGQLSQRWIGAFVERHKGSVRLVDQSVILLVVYTAFSEAIGQGLWQQLPLRSLAGLLFIDVVLLALVMVIATVASRRLGFNREDEITIVFCSSKKSLASGVPMAKVLFTGHALGAVVLPLMLFHQLQLMVCGVLTQKYAQRADAAEAAAAAAAAPSTRAPVG